MRNCVSVMAKMIHLYTFCRLTYIHPHHLGVMSAFGDIGNLAYNATVLINSKGIARLISIYLVCNGTVSSSVICVYRWILP